MKRETLRHQIVSSVIRSAAIAGRAKSIDEALRIWPDLGMLRTMRSGEYQQIVARNRGECLWCQSPIAKHRSFCNHQCASSLRIRLGDFCAIRAALKQRDNEVCCSCGIKSKWQADHILPVSECGGLCGLENLQTLCIECHASKTETLAAEWL